MLKFNLCRNSRMNVSVAFNYVIATSQTCSPSEFDIYSMSKESLPYSMLPPCINNIYYYGEQVCDVHSSTTACRKHQWIFSNCSDRVHLKNLNTKLYRVDENVYLQDERKIQCFGLAVSIIFNHYIFDKPNDIDPYHSCLLSCESLKVLCRQDHCMESKLVNVHWYTNVGFILRFHFQYLKNSGVHVQWTLPDSHKLIVL